MTSPNREGPEASGSLDIVRHISFCTLKQLNIIMKGSLPRMS